jgi:hypothetical protein
MSCTAIPALGCGAAPPRSHIMLSIPPYRRTAPQSPSAAIGTSRTSCTTHATSRSRRISPGFATSRASSRGCAPSPTTSCAAIGLQRSTRIAMLPLSPDSKHCSNGTSVESVEQPWGSGTGRARSQVAKRRMICAPDRAARGQKIGGQDVAVIPLAGVRVGHLGHSPASAGDAQGKPR